MAISPYTHKRVLHSENYVRSLINPSINAFKNNVSNKLDPDIYTELGILDVQYTTYDLSSPFIDYISVLKHKEHCVKPDKTRDHPKFWKQVKQLNSDIKVFQSLGYSIEEIYHCLKVYASKELTPGKFMNEKYDYVAYVKYVPRTFIVESHKIIDLNYLRNVSTSNITIAFNLKDKWNSLNDFHHSAYIKYPSHIIEKATVTEKFM